MFDSSHSVVGWSYLIPAMNGTVRISSCFQGHYIASFKSATVRDLTSYKLTNAKNQLFSQHHSNPREEVLQSGEPRKPLP